LGEISTEIVSGIACGKANAIPDGVLHLRPFSVTPEGSLSISDAPRIPANLIPNGRLGFRRGDILFNNTNSTELVGKSAVFSAPLEASFSNHMTRVRVDATKADPRYVQAFLHHLYHRRFFEGRATRWVGQAAFGTAQLKAIKVPLRPLDEQRRIVGLLDRAAEIRQRSDAARAKARAIIPALFVDMFGDPATNPKAWSIATVGNVLDSASYGTSQKASDNGAGLPIIRMGNVTTNGQLDTTDLKYVELIDQEREKAELVEGDLLFNRTNSKELVGKTGLWDGRFEAVVASYFIRVRVNPKIVLPAYLWAFLNTSHMKRVLFDTARGAIGQANINAKELRAFRIPVPPITLQAAFAAQAKCFEATARVLDGAATKAHAMEAALAAQVFGELSHANPDKQPMAAE
jgi:type I restriction enzyme S subunit